MGSGGPGNLDWGGQGKPDVPLPPLFPSSLVASRVRGSLADGMTAAGVVGFGGGREGRGRQWRGGAHRLRRRREPPGRRSSPVGRSSRAKSLAIFLEVKGYAGRLGLVSERFRDCEPGKYRGGAYTHGVVAWNWALFPATNS
jgi:hypothetical protein